MRSKLTASLLRSIALMSIVAAAGCSGGGSSGGGDGGLSLSRSSVTFQAGQNGSAPVSQGVAVTITAPDAYYLFAGYPPGVTQPSWLNVSIAGSSTHPSVVLTITRTDLAPATYETTVRVVIARADQSIIAFNDVLVTYTVIPMIVIGGNLAFTHILGGPTQTKPLSVSGSTGVAFTVSASEPWVTLGSTSGTTPASVDVGFDPVGLVAGSYSATVTVTGAGQTNQLPVTLQITDPQLVVTKSSLTFSGVNGAPIAAQTLDLSVTNGTAVEFTATPSAGWIVLGQPSGTTPATVTIGIDPSVGPLASGAHAGTVTFATTSGMLLTATVDVAATLTDPELVVTKSSLTFSGVNGAPIAAQTLDLSITNGTAVGFTATPSAGWIVLGQPSGTTPATVTIGLDPSVGPLASGTHAGTVTFATSSGIPLTATVDVDATLTQATLSVPAALVLGGSNGRDFSARPLQVSTNTGPNGYAFAAAPSEAWMSLSASSGDASGTPTTLQVTPLPDALTGGTRTGRIDVTATVNGDALAASVPVTLNVEAHRLLVSALGVALTKTPGASLLSRTLRVRDNLGRAAPWTASSDQTWLSVTPAGTGDGDLALTADPTGLPADQLYLATVTVSSSDASVEDTETVRVGLWVGSAAPVAQTVSGAFSATLATDPVRPYVYAHTGGASVSVYNVHTGALVGTIPAVAGSLAGMAVSGDGSILYAIDKATWKLAAIDLDTWTAGTPVSLANTTTPYPRVAWTRTGWQPVVVVTDGTVRDATDLRVLSSSGYGSEYSPRVATSLDGSVFCAAACQSLAWSAVGGGTLTVGARSGFLAEEDGALSLDGAVEYEPVISGYGSVGNYSWVGYSTTTGQLAIQFLSGKAYPNNVEVGWDGRVYAGRDSSISTEPDLWVFTPAGAQVGSLRVASAYNHALTDGSLAVSGDGLRILGVTSDYSTTQLRIVNAP